MEGDFGSNQCGEYCPFCGIFRNLPKKIPPNICQRAFAVAVSVPTTFFGLRLSAGNRP